MVGGGVGAAVAADLMHSMLQSAPGPSFFLLDLKVIRVVFVDTIGFLNFFPLNLN